MNHSTNPNWKKKRFFFGFIFIIGFFAIGGVVMLLWNWLVPSIFHFSPINYWQALGLFILSRILFGGFHFRPRNSYKKPPFANQQFKEKFINMSDEERQVFKEQWRKRCEK